MTGHAKKRAAAWAYSFAVAAVIAVGGTQAATPPGQAGRENQTPRASAPSDFTGVWVSLVTEDWRWRMVTPPKGDYVSIPLNPAGQKVAGEWDLATDRASGNECRPFGAAGLMRIPMRMRVSWQDDATMKLESDAGQQVRLFQFAGAPPAGGAPSWQGYSAAQWVKQPQGRGIMNFGGGRGGNFSGGKLKVVTTQMRAGYLRKNGIPYSDKAVLTEYFVRLRGPGGEEYLTVISKVEDPTYLNEPFLTSTEFRRESDDSKWHPTGCEVDPPRE